MALLSFWKTNQDRPNFVQAHMPVGREPAPTPTLSLGKRLVLYLMLFLVVCALPLMGLEVYLRRMSVNPIFQLDTRGLLVPSPIPGLGYRMAFNYSKGAFPTDEFGFRRRPDGDKPVQRSVLLLGDSVAFAGGVPYNASFAVLLEEQLTRELGQRIAVWNAGVPGYNTAQESLLLKDLQKRVKPNLIIVQFCMNDYLDPVALTAANTLDATKTAGDGFSLLSLLNSSRAIFFLKEKVKDVQKLHPEWFPVRLHYIHYIYKRSGWLHAKDALREIAETARQMKVPLLVVIFPVEPQLRIGDHAPEDDLVRFAKSEGIDVLDLYPSFVGHWREHLFFDYSVEQHVVDKVHLSQRGHSLAAQEIATSILHAPELSGALQSLQPPPSRQQPVRTPQ